MKILNKIIFLLALCCLTLQLRAQINVGISNTPSVVNAYYPVTSIAGTNVTVGARTGVSHSWAIGDRALLIQMTGSTAVNGGKFEYAEVTAVAGSVVTLDSINRSYTTTEAVQLVWVPYDATGITVIANVLALDWNGSTGGIVSLLTDGSLTMNGSILANGAGFCYNDANTISGPDIYYGGAGGSDAYRGGSGGGGYGSPGSFGTNFGHILSTGEVGTYNGGQPASSVFPYTGGGGGGGGVGAAGSGASGGPHSGGGGGGAGFGAGGCGGFGAEDGGAGGEGHVGGTGDTDGISGTGTAITGGFYGISGGGGGGARYIGGEGGEPGRISLAAGGFSGSNGGTSPTGKGGDGGGSTPAAYHNYQDCDGSGNCPDPRAWMGGGGQNNFANSIAICGGGIVLIYANEIITNNQTIAVNGDDGVEFDPSASSSNGGTGGGGGGIIVVNTNMVSSGTLSLCVLGGKGGAGSSNDGQHGGGSGGGGGAGVVWINQPNGALVTDNTSGVPPVLANITFCVGGGAGGDIAFNAKTAAFSGGGGCGGTGAVRVNPNAEIFSLPVPCNLTDAGKTLETCNDNSTNTTTQTADDYITFSLNPTGADLGTTYSVTVDNGGTVTLDGGGAATGVSYGAATAFRLQDGSADGATTFTITITDDTDGTCSITTTVMQASCSPCTTTPYMVCDDGSNPATLTADAGYTDYQWFNEAGMLAGETNQILIVTNSTNGLGDGAEQFYYTALDGMGSVITLNCPIYITTGFCSTCVLTTGGQTAEICNDNTTNPTSADDYITFSLNPTGIDIGSTYSLSVDNGGTVTLAAGGVVTGLNYGSATAFRLQDGSADGTTTYTITITDDADNTCMVTTSLMQSACSSCPSGNCGGVTAVRN